MSDQKGRSYEQRIVEALEVIAGVLTKIVEEGITIYSHDDGPEARN